MVNNNEELKLAKELKLKNSIASKFSKYIVALVFIIIISLVISIKSQEKVYNENFEQNINYIAEVIGESAKNAMLTDLTTFKDLLVLLTKDKDKEIVYVIVISEDDRVLESTIESYKGKHVKELGDKFSQLASLDTKQTLRKAKDPHIRKKLLEDKVAVIDEIENIIRKYPDLRVIFTLEQVKETLKNKLQKLTSLENDLEGLIHRKQYVLNNLNFQNLKVINNDIASIESEIINTKVFIDALYKMKNLVEKREEKTLLLSKMDLDNMIYEVSVPLKSVTVGNYGSLRIGFSPKREKNTIRMIYIKSIIIGIVFVIIGLGLSLYLARIITKPIGELANGAEILGSGNLFHRINIKTGDEIELLANRFNNMAEKLNESYSSLEQKVQERTCEYLDATKELQRAYKKLQATQMQLIHSEKMTSLGQLVAGVAHELNNPIGFIYGNITPLNKSVASIVGLIDVYKGLKISDEDKQQVQKYIDEHDLKFLMADLKYLLEDIHEGARRAQKIVYDLRNFSRPDEAEYEEADIHQGINSTLNLLVNQYKHRITVHKEFGEIPVVSCYVSQLNQVWMNLLVNASQSIKGNGDVWITTYLENDMVVIKIRDSGEGIKKELCERIFDPFFTTKPVGEGTGLGLSITHSIIKKHSGTIEVESEVGVGSTFTIKLPVKRYTG